MESHYDVIVIGARVAGSSLATLLARQGRSVLLVDQATFPSDTLSTHCLSPAGLSYLRRLGALDAVMEAGFRPLTRHRIHLEDCLVEAPAGPRGAFSLAPSRPVLDKVLLDVALAAGAELSDRTSARGLLHEDGAVCGAVLHTQGGEERRVRARLMVGADGRTSQVAKWVEAPAYAHTPALRAGYYGYYEGIQPLGEAALEMYFSADRLGYLFPMRPGEDCLAIEVRPEEWDRFHANPTAEFEGYFRSLPGMAERLRGARLVGRLRGQTGIANFLRVPFGAGWALSGDAACLKDPATGSGIGDALCQAFLLANSLETWFGGAAWEETMADYQRLRDRTLGPAMEGTIEFARRAGLDPAGMNRLRAALCNPIWARLVMTALPAHLPDLVDESTLAGIDGLARIFAPQEARIPAGVST